ncbi:MAG: energy transducer TonB [Calditrichota bacterium]
MKGSFFMSLGLHAMVGIAMVWASGAASMKHSALPSATVVKLVRPKMPALPIGVPKPSKEGDVVPESEPPLQIPKPKKDKAKATLEQKTSEKPKPKPKRDKTPSTKPSGGTGGKELVGDAGVLRVAGGDGFEYDFYLAVVQSKIEQNFRPPPGVRGQTLATVAFTIEKNGGMANIALAKSSGNLLIDQAAERAVRAAGRFPPLPPQYDQGKLDINFEFVVNPIAGR